MTTAKLFWTGNSQAIRLPKAFRFLNTDQVRIEKQGNKIVIEPIVNDWQWLDELYGADESWQSAIEQHRQEIQTQERDWGCFE